MKFVVLFAVVLFSFNISSLGMGKRKIFFNQKTERKRPFEKEDVFASDGVGAPAKKRKKASSETEVAKPPKQLTDCLQKIYTILVPLCKEFRAYASERPDKKPWENGSYGPAYLLHWATCLDVVRNDIGNNLCLSLWGNSNLSALTYLANEDAVERLKMCIESFKTILAEHELPSHQTDFATLSELADQLIKNTKAAQAESLSVSKIKKIFGNDQK